MMLARKSTALRKLCTLWTLAAAAWLATVPAAGRQGPQAPSPPLTQPPAPHSPALRLAPCQLPGLSTPARCGSYEVYEDRAARAGRKISLRLAVLPPRSGKPAPDPLFVVVGGPGQGATSLAGALAPIFAEVLADREIVLIDQRGSGGSNPLNCKLPGSDDDPQSYFGDMLPVDAIRACRAKLDADPALYTTPIAMDDLDDVRAALGYDKINLYGSSYGSRAVLVYMRQHPEQVRSAMLRGVVPTDMRTPLYYARDTQRALGLLFKECKADAACNAAYPDLERQFEAVEQRLARGPANADVELPGGAGRRFNLALPRDEFNEGIRFRLYSEESNQIPRFIARAFAGDYSEIAKLALRQRRAAAQGNLLSVGLYLSVTCSEDVPFIEAGEAERLAAGTFLGTYRVDQQRKACAAWPRGKLPPDYLENVRSNAPTLLISGVRDPVAPPVWGEQVARHLTQATHLVLPQGFHGLPDPCVRKLMNDFVIQGSVKGLDTSCVQEVHPAPFILPDGQPESGGQSATVPHAEAPRPAGGRAPAGTHETHPSDRSDHSDRSASPADSPGSPVSPGSPGFNSSAGSAAQGLWEGALIYKRGEIEVDVTLELARDAQGKWVGTIDVPNQNMKFFPLTKVHAEGDEVGWQLTRFSHKSDVMVETPFTGKLSADGGTMSGDFFEGGKNHVPLTLRRIGEAGSPREEPRLAPVIPLSDSGGELQAAFNRDAGKTRLILLLSPT